MHLRFSVAGLLLSLLSPLHAQTDHPTSPSDVARAVAVYEWMGDLAHPTAARLLPVCLFLHAHLEDAGVYLPQPIPFALQPGTLYLIQQSSQTGVEIGVPGGRSWSAGVETLGALDIQSAHSTATGWAAYGRLLTPAEAAPATTPPHIVILSEAKDPLSAQTAGTTTHPRHEKKKKPQAYVTPPTTPILDDPDRPILQSNTSTAPATIPELTTLPPGLHQAAAISDAVNRPPETFAYLWPSPTLRDQTLQALEALALPPLTHYLAFNHLAPTHNLSSFAKGGGPASPSSSESSGSPTLLHPRLLAFTLSPDAPPTYILTAESPLTTSGPVYITLIAQPDATGHPHLTLLSLTDATHLDRTPRLLPIDAVDPDATGRADLLFELRFQTTRQFALYTLTTNPPQQILLTTPIR
jgi:hypothetical protein